MSVQHETITQVRQRAPGVTDNEHGNRSGVHRSVERKASVSDLIARLTTPTTASRNKMRENSRVASSPNDLRPPKHSGNRRTSNPNDVPISRPFLMHKPSGPPLPRSPHQIRRKAPSPPTELPDQKLQTSKSTTSLSTSSNSQANSHGLSNESLSGESSVSYESNDSQLATSKSSTVPSTPFMGNNAVVSPGTQPTILHRRRLSAPAPVLNLTTPRAMSRAGLPLSAGTNSNNIYRSPVTPSSVTASPPPFIRSVNSNGGSSKESVSTKIKSPKEAQKDSQKHLQKDFQKDSHKDIHSKGSQTKDSHNRTSHSKEETHKDMSQDSQTDLKHELARLRDYNESLKVRNRQLKSRLDDSLAAQDQANVELSITQASRNALQQQVNGYETLHENTSKSLNRSRKLTKILKFNLQELKMLVEEKDLEIYRLAQKVKSGRSLSESEISDEFPGALVSPSSLKSGSTADEVEVGERD